MYRSVLAPALALLVCSIAAGPAFSQVQSAAPVAAAAPAKAKFIPPVKGEATIDVIPGQSKFVGKDIVTTFKIKNTSTGPIALLRLDEYWYDKAGKLVSSDTQRYMKPLAPGEVIEMTTKAPALPGAERAQRTFAHANGKVTAKAVKKME